MFVFLLESLVFAGLPLLLAGAAVCLSPNGLLRPVLFLVVASLILYPVYFIWMWLLDPGEWVVGHTLVRKVPSEVESSGPWLLLLTYYKTPMMAFAASAVPVLAVLLSLFNKERSDED
jgi:hypothetical protein